MAQDSNYIKLFIDEIEHAKSDSNLNVAMFCFGLQLGTKEEDLLRGIRKGMNLLPPFLPHFRGKWDIDDLRKIQNGSDSISVITDLPDGILFLMNQLKVIKKYKRDQWAFHYLYGIGLGYFNSKVITGSEFQYFLGKYPQGFTKLNKDLIEKLSQKFSLNDCSIKITSENSCEIKPILIKNVKDYPI